MPLFPLDVCFFSYSHLNRFFLTSARKGDSVAMVSVISVIFGFLFVLGIPIVFIMGLVSLSYVLVTGKFNLLIMFPHRMFKGLDMFVLLAIPLFALAGNLMNAVGITQRLISLVKSAVGHFTGGLAVVTCGPNMVMGGISGSAVADAAAIGSIMISSLGGGGEEGGFRGALCFWG